MSEMLSPAVYLRCSENSTEKPWNGLACRPGDETLDDELGAQVEPGDLADHLGLQVFLGGAGHEKPPRHQSSRASASDCSLTAELRGTARHGRAHGVALLFGSALHPFAGTGRSYLGVSGSRISLTSRLTRVSVD